MKHVFKDITGQKFGRLTAIRRLPNNVKNNAVWECRCDCGRVIDRLGIRLRYKSPWGQSCGCGHYKHGESYTRKYRMVIKARHRAKKSGIQCSIGTGDFEVPERCPMLGIRLVFSGERDSCPALDRIDNQIGYVPGNVWVISQRANRIKSDASIEELVNMVEAIKSRLQP